MCRVSDCKTSCVECQTPMPFKDSWSWVKSSRESLPPVTYISPIYMSRFFATCNIYILCAECRIWYLWVATTQNSPEVTHRTSWTHSVCVTSYTLTLHTEYMRCDVLQPHQTYVLYTLYLLNTVDIHYVSTYMCCDVLHPHTTYVVVSVWYHNICM